jgi:hypothetical protein
MARVNKGQRVGLRADLISCLAEVQSLTISHTVVMLLRVRRSNTTVLPSYAANRPSIDNKDPLGWIIYRSSHEHGDARSGSLCRSGGMRLHLYDNLIKSMISNCSLEGVENLADIRSRSQSAGLDA